MKLESSIRANVSLRIAQVYTLKAPILVQEDLGFNPPVLKLKDSGAGKPLESITP